LSLHLKAELTIFLKNLFWLKLEKSGTWVLQKVTNDPIDKPHVSLYLLSISYLRYRPHVFHLL